MGIHKIASWWPRTRLLRLVHKAMDSTISSPPPARSLLNGSGVVLVPADPVEAALSSLAIRDFCGRLSCPVRLAGPPGSLRWMSDPPGTSIEISDQLAGKAFSEWLEFHRAHRADWCLLATSRPTPLEEATLVWLGAGTRFAAFGACESKAANVLIQSGEEASSDAQTRRLLRVLLPDFPSLHAPPPVKAGPTLLEIPPDLPERGRKVKAWCQRLSQLASRHPILVAHSEALPQELHDLARSFGPRVALAHLSSAKEVQELARRTGLWVAARTPASALAALEGCRVHLVGGGDAAKGFPHPQRLTVSTKIDGQDLELAV